MSIKAWLKDHRTPLLAGAALVAVEMLTAAMFWNGAPDGQRWLGNTLLFPNDTAVYLSYIEQGAQGGVRLQNLYAVEPAARRLDIFWSTLGLAARSDLPPILILEIARWCMTMVLAFALFRLTKRFAADRRDRSYLTWLMVLGVGGGWLYTFWIYAVGGWTIGTRLAPDIATEFSVFPALLSGPHIILSIALLATALDSAWSAFGGKGYRTAVLSALATAFLTSFHPYFIPVLGVFWCLAMFRWRKLGAKRLALTLGLLGCGMLPAAALYVPLYFDQTFRTHHLDVNRLPLAPSLSWIFTLAPFAAAFAWRWRRKDRLRQEEHWLVAWLVAAAICVCLPFPWKRKFTEGVSLALILLTAPFWMGLRDRMAGTSPAWVKGLMVGILAFGLGFGSFQLLTSNFAWSHDPARATWLYRPTALFDAWSSIKGSSGRDSILVADDFWTNSFTPAYTGRRVIVGNDHETPDFGRKADEWRLRLIGGGPDEALRYLAENSITHLILTKTGMQEKLSAGLEEAGWRKTFDRNPVMVWTAPGS